MFNSEHAQKKWGALLDHADCEPIKDNYRRAVTATLLENQERAMREERAQQSFQLNESETQTADMGKFDPTLIALVRRAMPSLIAYDVAGVQPMSGPTGLIFAMVPVYKSTKGDKTSGNLAFGSGAPDTGFGGDGEGDTTGSGYDTASGEELTGTHGTSSPSTGAFGAMGFQIDKATVTARTRALKAGYTMELAQDLKAVHGLDAESELANILSTEILGEINREVIGQIRSQAKTGTEDGSTVGTFDLNDTADNLGARWGQEKFQSLVFNIEKEANQIGRETRRGKGNFVIVSPNVGSALAASGNLNYSDGLTATGLSIDTVGNTFAGTLNGSTKVYIDPYQTTDQVIVGYRGANAIDAGLFYCPYVPLTMVKAVGEEDFQPRIAFKTRYGLISNPIAVDSENSVDGLSAAGSNIYYRKFTVTNI